jgi:hypothetical protein
MNDVFELNCCINKYFFCTSILILILIGYLKALMLYLKALMLYLKGELK